MSTPYAFTTSARLQTRLSSAGVALRVDDDASAASDAINDATVEILGYTQILYDPALLAQSAWIELKARDLAVFYLCGRRNLPITKTVEKLYEKAIKDLEMVQSGAWILPDVPQRKAIVPVLTNQRTASYPVNRVVNVTGKSTGTPENYIDHPDRTDLLDYSI